MRVNTDMQDRGANNSQKIQGYCKLYTPVLHVCINPYLTNPLRHLLFPISLVVVMDGRTDGYSIRLLLRRLG